MGNVIEFPIKKTAEAKMQPKLDGKIKMLRLQFKHIREAQKELSKMQQECSRTEDEYDELLVELANRVGCSNVHYKYLKYSKRAKPVIDGDSVKMILT